jgi:hypothetical protein
VRRRPVENKGARRLVVMLGSAKVSGPDVRTRPDGARRPTYGGAAPAGTRKSTEYVVFP